MTLNFNAASHDKLWLDVRWAAGLHVLLGAPADGLTQVCELAWGQARPSSGRVTLGERVIVGSPQVRASIGSTSWHEPPIDRRGVEHRIESLRALHARAASSLDGRDALAQVGLSSLLDQTPNADAPRGAALAVALSLVNPSALVLADPLGIEGIDVPAVCKRLREVAVDAPVVVCTRRFSDALRLGANVYEFRGFRMVSGPVPARMLLRATGARFHAHVQDGAGFMAALLAEPAVSSVQAPLDRNVLEVVGDDAEGVSRAILRTSAKSQIALFSLSEGAAPVDSATQPAATGGEVG